MKRRDMTSNIPATSIGRSRKLRKLARMANSIASGRCDRMFADAETKAYMLADIEAEMMTLIDAEVDAFPGIYKRNSDGTISLVRDSERKVISMRVGPPRVRDPA